MLFSAKSDRRKMMRAIIGFLLFVTILWGSAIAALWITDQTLVLGLGLESNNVWLLVSSIFWGLGIFVSSMFLFTKFLARDLMNKPRINE